MNIIIIYMLYIEGLKPKLSITFSINVEKNDFEGFKTL